MSRTLLLEGIRNDRGESWRNCEVLRRNKRQNNQFKPEREGAGRHWSARWPFWVPQTLGRVMETMQVSNQHQLPKGSGGGTCMSFLTQGRVSFDPTKHQLPGGSLSIRQFHKWGRYWKWSLVETLFQYNMSGFYLLVTKYAFRWSSRYIQTTGQELGSVYILIWGPALARHAKYDLSV